MRQGLFGIIVALMLLPQLLLVSIAEGETAQASELWSTELGDVQVNDLAVLSDGRVVVVGQGYHGDSVGSTTLQHPLGWTEPTIGFYAIINSQGQVDRVETVSTQHLLASSSVTNVISSGTQFWVVSEMDLSGVDEYGNNILLQHYDLYDMLYPDASMISNSITPFLASETRIDTIGTDDFRVIDGRLNCLVLEETDNEGIKLTMTAGWRLMAQLTQSGDYGGYFGDRVIRNNASSSPTLGQFLDSSSSPPHMISYVEPYTPSPSECGTQAKETLTFPLWGYLDSGVNGYISVDMDGTLEDIRNFGFRTLGFPTNEPFIEPLWFIDDDETIGHDVNDNNQIEATIELLDILPFAAPWSSDSSLGDCYSYAMPDYDYVSLYRIDANTGCQDSELGYATYSIQDVEFTLFDAQQNAVLLGMECRDEEGMDFGFEASCSSTASSNSFTVGLYDGEWRWSLEDTSRWTSGALVDPTSAVLAASFSGAEQLSGSTYYSSGATDILLARISSTGQVSASVHGSSGSEGAPIISAIGYVVGLAYSACSSSSGCTIHSPGGSSQSLSYGSLVWEKINAGTLRSDSIRIGQSDVEPLLIRHRSSGEPVILTVPSSGGQVGISMWFNQQSLETRGTNYDSAALYSFDINQMLGTVAMVVGAASTVVMLDWASDHDGDGSFDFEDFDDDGDGIDDNEDDCASGDTGWTSSSNTDFDGDGCRDAGEDDDDDNDGVLDSSDAFPLDSSEYADADGDGIGDNADQCDDGMSDTGWLSSTATDHDTDGCRDGGEDDDDDNDGIPDSVDACPAGDTGWTSGVATDRDGDGCQDNSNEDRDDDNDGRTDSTDDCDPDSGYPNSEIGWISNSSTDHDSDGCKDGGEDDDDDNDGVRNSGDQCQLGLTFDSNSQSDHDHDGCEDVSEDDDDDNDGVPDSEDEFPLDATEQQDSDADGVGDNSDDCPQESGDSNKGTDVGCPDSDGDGWSDREDPFPNDSTQWTDQDNDGFGDTPGGDNPDDCPALFGESTKDRRGCPDQDGDGYSDPDVDWTTEMGADSFPIDGTQHSDDDGDGYGSNPDGNQPDACPFTHGASTFDRLGCPDADGDGWSDPDPQGKHGMPWTTANDADQFPDDPYKWKSEKSSITTIVWTIFALLVIGGLGGGAFYLYKQKESAREIMGDLEKRLTLNEMDDEYQKQKVKDVGKEIEKVAETPTAIWNIDGNVNVENIGPRTNIEEMNESQVNVYDD